MSIIIIYIVNSHISLWGRNSIWQGGWLPTVKFLLMVNHISIVNLHIMALRNQKGGGVKKDVLFIMKVWCIPPTVHLLGCLMNITTWWWFYCSFVCPASHIFIIQLSAWVVTCYLSVFPTSAKHKTAHEVEEAISLVREPHDPSIPDWIHMPSLS